MTRCGPLLIAVLAVAAQGCNRDGGDSTEPEGSTSGSTSTGSTTGTSSDSTDGTSGDTDSGETSDTGSPCVEIDDVPTDRTQWRMDFDAGGDEVGISVDLLSSGTAVVVGTVTTDSETDLFVAAHDTDGERIWMWTEDFGGTDTPEVVRATPDGGFVIGGNVGAPSRAWVGKYDAMGMLEWEASPSVTEGQAEEVFGLADLEVDTSGAVGVLGATSWDGGELGWISLFDPNGLDLGVLWSSSEVTPTEFGIAGSGSFLLSLNASGNPGIDGLVRALDDDGATDWETVFDIHETDLRPELLSGEDPIVFGSTGYPGADGGRDGTVGSVSLEGDLGWMVPVGYCGDDFVLELAAAADETLVVLQLHYADIDDPLSQSGVVRALSPNGEPLWEERIPDVDDGWPNAVAASDDDFVFVVGAGGADGSYDYYVARIDP